MNTDVISPRSRLIGLSNSVKILVDSGQFDSINEALVAFYMNQDPCINCFKTFREWKNEGKFVRKGEKGFLVWGRKIKPKAKNDGQEEVSEYQFFPVSYIFADTQVN